MSSPDSTSPPATAAVASALVVVRDGASGLEVFCLERPEASRSKGGVVSFPGGRVVFDDLAQDWKDVVIPAGPRVESLAATPAQRQALMIAACREALDRAAILPVDRALPHMTVMGLRRTLAGSADAFRSALDARGLKIDLASLVPCARWVTPVGDARRFDTRYFLVRAPSGLDGLIEERDGSSSYWATPGSVLARWDQGEVALEPATHYLLLTLSKLGTVDDALARAETLPLSAVEPGVIDYDGTRAQTLPGDPGHSDRTRLLEGHTRYVLRDEQWRPEAAPAE